MAQRATHETAAGAEVVVAEEVLELRRPLHCTAVDGGEAMNPCDELRAQRREGALDEPLPTVGAAIEVDDVHLESVEEGRGAGVTASPPAELRLAVELVGIRQSFRSPVLCERSCVQAVDRVEECRTVTGGGVAVGEVELEVVVVRVEASDLANRIGPHQRRAQREVWPPHVRRRAGWEVCEHSVVRGCALGMVLVQTVPGPISCCPPHVAPGAAAVLERLAVVPVEEHLSDRGVVVEHCPSPVDVAPGREELPVVLEVQPVGRRDLIEEHVHAPRVSLLAPVLPDELEERIALLHPAPVGAVRPVVDADPACDQIDVGAAAQE